jgi:hypothetical protein
MAPTISDLTPRRAALCGPDPFGTPPPLPLGFPGSDLTGAWLPFLSVGHL